MKCPEIKSEVIRKDYDFYFLRDTLLKMYHLFSYQNLFYVSIGLFILSYIFNYLFAILLILPFEKLIKRKIIIEKMPDEIYLLNSIVEYK